VNKGEKGIRILAPAPYKIKEERDKLDPVTGEPMLDKDGMPQTEEVEVKIPAFRMVSVFDVSSTEGELLSELEAKELLSTVEGYGDFIKAITYVAPVPITFEDIPGDSKGYFNTDENRIAVQEGIAFTVCSHFGIDTSAYSFNYIGGWSSDRDMIDSV